MAHKLWTRRFNQDPTIVGRTFVLNGIPMTLVGVMPQRFTKMGADVWMVRSVDRNDPRADRDYWNFQAKLKSGLSIERARADVEVIARRLAKLFPKNYPASFSVQIISWVDSLVGQFRSAAQPAAQGLCQR